jgi:hypothetical protein
VMAAQFRGRHEGSPMKTVMGGSASRYEKGHTMPPIYATK